MKWAHKAQRDTIKFYQVRNKCQETGNTPPLTETTCKTHTPQITLNLWIFLQLLGVYMYVFLTMRSEKVWLPLHQSPLRQMNQTHLSSLPQSTKDTSVITPDTDIWELNLELLSKQPCFYGFAYHVGVGLRNLDDFSVHVWKRNV